MLYYVSGKSSQLSLLLNISNLVEQLFYSILISSEHLIKCMFLHDNWLEKTAPRKKTLIPLVNYTLEKWLSQSARWLDVITRQMM